MARLCLLLASLVCVGCNRTPPVTTPAATTKPVASASALASASASATPLPPAKPPPGPPLVVASGTPLRDELGAYTIAPWKLDLKNKALTKNLEKVVKSYNGTTITDWHEVSGWGAGPTTLVLTRKGLTLGEWGAVRGWSVDPSGTLLAASQQVSAENLSAGGAPNVVSLIDVATGAARVLPTDYCTTMSAYFSGDRLLTFGRALREKDWYGIEFCVIDTKLNVVQRIRYDGSHSLLDPGHDVFTGWAGLLPRDRNMFFLYVASGSVAHAVDLQGKQLVSFDVPADGTFISDMSEFTMEKPVIVVGANADKKKITAKKIDASADAK